MVPKEAQTRLIGAHEVVELLGEKITSVRNQLGPSAADAEVNQVLKESLGHLHQVRHDLTQAIGLVTVRS